MRQKMILLAVVAVCLAAIPNVTKAYEPERYYQSVDSADLADANDTLIVSDDKFQTAFNWSLIDQIYSVNDLLVFEIKQDGLWYYPYNFSASISLAVKFTNAANVTTDTLVTLSINYIKSQPSFYPASSNFIWHNAHRIQARVLSISFTDSIGSHVVPNILRLSGEITVGRSYDFSCSSDTTSSLNSTYDTTSRQLKIDWSPILGATEYDLEWTFYDYGSAQYSSSPTTASSFSALFKNNASRVTISDYARGYKISMLYPDGKLFYRIRGVQVLPNGQRICSPWTTSPTKKYSVSWHESRFNWVSTVSYAEEGKKKEAVHYFDGAQRNRQDVTRDNTLDTSIIAETIYDYHGRPALKVLPVPSGSSKIKYFSAFNLDDTLHAYSRNDFDIGDCQAKPRPMSPTSGASKYYSPSNTDKTTFNAYIADADSFPFSITEFTPDNTGRIGRQSNVGKDLMLGNGHETKYYYNKPSQQELDRLFGNDVGYADHYTKEMVSDPNGQINVSYKDAHDRVIATALAGANPSALQALDSAAVSDTMRFYLADGKLSDPYTLSSTFPFGVSTNSNVYSFQYNLFPNLMTQEGCNDTNVCYDCAYDVRILVTDICGSVVFDSSYKNYTLNDFDTVCSVAPTGISKTFSLTLNPGTYQLVKTVAVNQSAISFYNDLFSRRNSCKSFESFMSEAIAGLDFSGCNLTCDSCKAHLGTLSSYVSSYLQKVDTLVGSHTLQDSLNAINLYGQLEEECSQLCDVPDDCHNKYQAMLADLTPGGQYADYEIDYNTYSLISNDPTSIFHKRDTSWTYAYQMVTGYMDENGNLDTVLVHGEKRTPEQLSPFYFYINWKDSWATTLIPVHPEYCYYRFCIDNSESHLYDYNMMHTQTYAAAMDSGYFAPFDFKYGTGDPFMYNNKDSDDIIDARGRILKIYNDPLSVQYLDIWQAAKFSVIYPELTDSLHYIVKTDTWPDTSGFCEGDFNAYWIAFRSYYMALKTKFYNSQESAYVNTCKGCNKCIGSQLMPYSVMGQSGSCPSGSRQHIIDIYGPAVADCDPYHYKTPHFLEPPINGPEFNLSGSAVTLMTTKLAAAKDSLKVNCAAQCSSYVDTWKAKLVQCYLDSTSMDSVITGLLRVCKGGCDQDHPYGSSTTPVAITLNGVKCQSFEDVLAVMDTITPGCNGLLLDYPDPYSNPTYLGNNYVLTELPECLCEKLNSMHDFFVRVHPSDASTTAFNFFLHINYRTNYTDSEVEELLDLCNPNTCHYLSHPIQIPKEFECSGDCISCRQFQDMKNLFNISYPALAGNEHYEDMLTEFLNDTLHLHLSYAYYESFASECSTFVANDYISNYNLNCIQLDSLRNYYDKHTPFALWMNNATGYLLTMNQWRAFFEDSCRITLSAPSDSMSCRYLDSAWTNFIMHPIDPDASLFSVMVRFFNENYWPGLYDSSQYSAKFYACGIYNKDLFTYDIPHICDSLGEWYDKFLALYYGNGGSTFREYDSLTRWIQAYYLPIYSINQIRELLIGCGLYTHADENYDCSQLESMLKLYYAEESTDEFDKYIDDHFNISISPEQLTDWLNHCGLSLTDTTYLCDVPLFPTVTTDTVNCMEELIHLAEANATHSYALYVDSVKGEFTKSYLAQCLFTPDTLKGQYTINEYNYTLYYYDQGSNLVMTVPPQGVKRLTGSALTQVDQYRTGLNPTPVYPSHELSTRYLYSSLNNLTAQNTPDGGYSRFWYDKLGRIVVSQDSYQQTQNFYSYSLYDVLGRVYEAGRIYRTVAMSDSTASDTTTLNPWIRAGTRTQVTRTYYDKAAFSFSTYTSFTQANLLNRVASVIFQSVFNSDSTKYATATHYTYDILGNVTTILQEDSTLKSIGHHLKRIDYNFDLLSGKVNRVCYQCDSIDQFIHKYSYDAENKLVLAETSIDGYTWDHDATYSYYKHGPLARTVLGEHQVQGVDYAYTLQGWMKSVNSSHVDSTRDIGRDARTGTPTLNDLVGRDAYAFTLSYFNNDYNSISDSVFETAYTGSTFASNNPGLYNGNIRASSVSLHNIKKPDLTHGYKYDQLNRLVKVNSYPKVDTSGGNLNLVDTLSTVYSEAFAYDANGNITKLMRYDTTAMDSLRYFYYSGTNRLKYVTDTVASGRYAEDINNQTSTTNYSYYENGNLKQDLAEGLFIYWTNSGKIDSIVNSNSSTALKFIYDPMGNRVQKRYYPVLSDNTKSSITFYVRDAQGNQMATYDWKNRDTLKVEEYDIYGSSRLGMYHADSLIYRSTGGNFNYSGQNPYVRYDGRKEYELTNHLGNVLTTVSDKKIPVDKNSDNLADYFVPEIHLQQDYTAFGASLNSRKFSQGICITHPTLQTDTVLNDQFVTGIGGYDTLNSSTLSNSSGWLKALGSGGSNFGAKKNFSVLANKSYALSFSLDVTGLGTGGQIKAAVYNNTTLICSTAVSTSSTLSIPAPGSNATYTLKFFRSAGQSGNNKFFLIDNVLLTYIDTVGNLACNGDYRFGFNGQEKVDEIAGSGNHNTATFWEYDPRLGRRWNLDPKPQIGISDYAVNRDNPIWFTDPNGDSGNNSNEATQKQREKAAKKFDKKVTQPLKAMEENGATPNQIQNEADRLADKYQNTRWLHVVTDEGSANDPSGNSYISSATGARHQEKIGIRAYSSTTSQFQATNTSRPPGGGMVTNGNTGINAPAGSTVSVQFDPFAQPNALNVTTVSPGGTSNIMSTGGMITNPPNVFNQTTVITTVNAGQVQYSVQNSNPSIAIDTWQLNIQVTSPPVLNPVPIITSNFPFP